MSYLRRVWSAIRGKRPQAQPFRLRSRYDAAGDQLEQREHWAWTDSLSANAINDPATRQKLRDRARYECRNNGYAKGLVAGIAQDVVGTGPRLQLSFGEVGTEQARTVEAAWRAWCEAVDLADKLRIKHESKIRDGECFALLTQNELIEHPVKLDVRLVECDRVETPLERLSDESIVDGIQFDNAGNPVAYFISRTHPGDRLNFGLGYMIDYQRVLARNVLHWYRADRPGQARGVSELAPALNLFGQLRRYTLATVTAAEFAATVAGVMETDLPPPEDADAISVSQGTEIPLAPGSLLTLASGWKANAFKGEQPTSTYAEFKGEILGEAGRSANAPRDVVSGDASNFNFASVRIGQLPYQRGVWIERRRDRRQLDKVFRAWWEEYTRIPSDEGGPQQGLPSLDEAVWDWHWDGFAWMDPAKDASAVEMRLAMNMTTLSEECAAEGKDWEEVLNQRAKELERLEELGLPTLMAAVGQPVTEDSEESSEDGAEPGKAGGARKAAASGDVQGTALNGAQIASLVLICDKLSLKEYPADAAESMIRAAFPLMDRKLISKFIRSLEKHEPPEREEEPAFEDEEVPADV